MAKLNDLQVIDHLQIGPVVLSKNKLRMPYTITRGKKTSRQMFAYRYESMVFDPHVEADQNLAFVLGAQIAINYGLFCKKITFVGLIDEHDKKFLKDMLENTAREIFVHKLQMPNVYLEGVAKNFPFVKAKHYSQAKLVFKGVFKKAWRRPWSIAPEKSVVLSSGGKESLLSFGLLREISKDVRAVYVNEAGRHWFTAYNGFHYFKKNVPHTQRVWTNSDQMFNWFLKHLNFVRKDHHSIKADYYPIRLWTLPIFSFGVLPWLKQWGYGRLVVGDEHDTTVVEFHKGLKNYGGLYDQSRFFDNYASSYFKKKQWNVRQFSILRPLSEILVQKILSKRYPALQAVQVSCHSASIKSKTAKPCGNCEKCRRIVSMLIILKVDPKRCGYTSKQIKSCILSLKDEHLHQEEAMESLIKKVLLENIPMAQQRSEVLSLRFNPIRSPKVELPHDIRKSLIKIFNRYL